MAAQKYGTFPAGGTNLNFDNIFGTCAVDALGEFWFKFNQNISVKGKFQVKY